MQKRIALLMLVSSISVLFSAQLSALTVQELIAQCKYGPMGTKERGDFMSAQNSERANFNRQQEAEATAFKDWQRKIDYRKNPDPSYIEKRTNDYYTNKRKKEKEFEARQQDAWDQAVVSCSLKQDLQTFHKGFDTQKEELRKKLEDVHQKLEKISPEDKALGIRQFSAQEWKSLIDALQIGYTKKGHDTIDAYIFKIPIHNYEKLDANWKSTVSFVSDASKVQKFVDYLVSLKNLPESQRFGLTPASIDLIQNIFNEKSQETTGNECAGLEILFGPDFNQLTIAEQAYVDQLGCRMSGYFGGFK